MHINKLIGSKATMHNLQYMYCRYKISGNAMNFKINIPNTISNSDLVPACWWSDASILPQHFSHCFQIPVSLICILPSICSPLIIVHVLHLPDPFALLLFLPSSPDMAFRPTSWQSASPVLRPPHLRTSSSLDSHNDKHAVAFVISSYPLLTTKDCSKRQFCIDWKETSKK